MAGLKLEEFSDRELLHRVNDLGDEEGWVTVPHFAVSLKLSHPNPNQCVGVRFGWMRRFGILEKDKSGENWRLTAVGDRVRRARLTASEERAFGQLSPEKGMEALLSLGATYKAAATRPEGHMMRRGWRYATARKK